MCRQLHIITYILKFPLVTILQIGMHMDLVLFSEDTITKGAKSVGEKLSGGVIESVSKRASENLFMWVF